MKEKRTDTRARLTLWQWFKARALEFRLRRRWKRDPQWREHVKGAVNKEVSAPDFRQKVVKRKNL